MKKISATEAAQSLDEIMDQVCAKGAPIVVTRRGKPSVVILSLREYGGLNETLHLLNSPRNAMRLLRSIQSFSDTD